MREVLQIPAGLPPGGPAEGARPHHEGGLTRVAQGVGHVVAEVATFLLVPNSRKAEEAVRHASADRLHDVNPYTMETPAWWDSTRRT